MTSIQELDQKYLLQNYSKIPLCFVKGENDLLFDEAGNSYIDNLAGIAVCSLGHGRSDLAMLAAEQISKLQHTSNMFFNREQAELAQVIVDSIQPGKVFFGNSGAEANEAALKLMRAHGQSVASTKQVIISLKGSFHGRTMGTMSMTGQAKIHDGFGDILAHHCYVEPNDLSALEKAFDENVCGMILEPIQGEGGVRPLQVDFVNAARELCTKFNAVMCVDEVQSGVGRSGSILAYQNFDVLPDAISMAKGLGGGMPIGALWIREDFTQCLKAGMHGSTFGGNHLACKMAKHVWQIVNKPEFLDDVCDKSDIYQTKLNNLCEKSKLVKEIRGQGLMLGLALADELPAREVAKELLTKGIIVGTAGDNTLRLVPPLTISKEHIEKTCQVISEFILAKENS